MINMQNQAQPNGEYGDSAGLWRLQRVIGPSEEWASFPGRSEGPNPITDSTKGQMIMRSDFKRWNAAFGDMAQGQDFNPWNVFVGALVPSCIMRAREMNPTEKLCLARLYQYSGQDGECYPSQLALARELGISQRQVNRIIADLVRQGFVEIVRPAGLDRLRHRTARYRLLWHRIYAEAAAEE